MPDIGRYRRAILILYLVAVLAATLTPISVRADEVDDLDKIAHAILFAVLAVLFFWNAAPPRRVASVAMATLLSTACAGLVEVLQMRVPARSGDPADFVAGALGAAAAAAIAYAIDARRERVGSERFGPGGDAG